jgi:hypothetical protein
VIGGTRTGFRRAAPPVLYREFAADVATGGVEGKAGLGHCVKLSETLAENFTAPSGRPQPGIYRP